MFVEIRTVYVNIISNTFCSMSIWIDAIFGHLRPTYDHQIFMSSIIEEKNVYCRVSVQSHVNDLDSKYNLLRDPVS